MWVYSVSEIQLLASGNSIISISRTKHHYNHPLITRDETTPIECKCKSKCTNIQANFQMHVLGNQFNWYCSNVLNPAQE